MTKNNGFCHQAFYTFAVSFQTKIEVEGNKHLKDKFPLQLLTLFLK